jgi:hypothetical protein
MFIFWMGQAGLVGLVLLVSWGPPRIAATAISSGEWRASPGYAFGDGGAGRAGLRRSRPPPFERWGRYRRSQEQRHPAGILHSRGVPSEREARAPRCRRGAVAGGEFGRRSACENLTAPPLGPRLPRRSFHHPLSREPRVEVRPVALGFSAAEGYHARPAAGEAGRVISPPSGLTLTPFGRETHRGRSPLRCGEVPSNAGTGLSRRGRAAGQARPWPRAAGRRRRRLVTVGVAGAWINLPSSSGIVSMGDAVDCGADAYWVASTQRWAAVP